MAFLDYLRQQAALPPEQRDPDPPEETPEERQAKRMDLERRINLDIAASNAANGTCPRCGTSAPAGVCPTCDHDFTFRLAPRGGVINIPQCMLDAAGVEEMDR